MPKLSNEARKELEAVAATPDSEIRDWRVTRKRRQVRFFSPFTMQRREQGVTHRFTP